MFREKYSRKSFFHSCATLKGHSGSLVLAVTDNAVLGVHSRESGSTNLAFRFDEVRKAIVNKGKLQSLGNHIATPIKVDKTGWALNIEKFENAIRQALAGDAPLDTLSTLLPSNIGVRHRLGSRRIIDLIVESGSLSALRSALEKEKFSTEELGSLLNRAIEQFDSYGINDPANIKELLRLGAIPQPETSGHLPQCSIKHRHEVYKILKDYNYDSNNC